MIDLSELIDDPDFSQAGSFFRVKQTVVDGELAEVKTPVSAQCIIQPFGNEDFQALPEGDKYKPHIRIFTAVDLNVGDYLDYQGERWRVIKKGNWSDYGYYDYAAVRYVGTEDINSKQPEFT